MVRDLFMTDFSGEFKTWTKLGICQAHRGLAQNLRCLAMWTELGLGGSRAVFTYVAVVPLTP